MAFPTDPKNPTYQRALRAFFEGGAPAPAQRERLPDEVSGVTVRRQAMVDEALSAATREGRLRALRALSAAFGLPPDLRVLYLALTPDDEGLALAALAPLRRVLADEGPRLAEETREQLRERLRTLEARSFSEALLSATAECLRALR